MTMIDVDTSPLQAAREWRGIGLVAAAMTSGLPLAQAEALEEGDPSAFGTIDEMIAAAVVYGSSLGIGRDEAVALLDRTVCRTGAQVQLPDAAAVAAEVERPIASFSGAVQQRSARIAQRDVVSTTPLTPELEDEIEEIFETHDERAEGPIEPIAAMPDVPFGPTPEQAVAASGEIHIGDEFGEAPWERSGFTSELEAWAEERAEDEAVVVDRPRRGEALTTRIGAGAHAAAERLVGTEKADAAAEWLRRSSDRLGDALRDGRERLRRSEHATLFVAIGGGAVLIAVLVALGGALGGDEPAGPGPADRSAVAAKTEQAPATDATTQPATPAKATPKVGPMLPPARLTLDIYNAGSKKGYAKEVAAQLDAAGYRIGEVTNAKGDYAGATIIHPKDMAREAKVLARRTGISTLQIAPGSTRRITIVVT